MSPCDLIHTVFTKPKIRIFNKRNIFYVMICNVLLAILKYDLGRKISPFTLFRAKPPIDVAPRQGSLGTHDIRRSMNAPMSLSSDSRCGRPPPSS